MLSISITDDWRTVYPGAIIGLLELSVVENPPSSHPLEVRKRETETCLRNRYQGFSRQNFLALPVMDAYVQYYKHFNKTYHVLLQVESIVFKGKDLPSVSPLVDANFMAEVQTFVGTAGHDAANLHEPIWIDISREGDQLIQMNGASKALRAGDMIMRDAQGISSSMLYGQDNRSPISAVTSHVLYVAYAPMRVSAQAVEEQLQQIEENIRLFSPLAVIEQHRLLSA